MKYGECDSVHRLHIPRIPETQTSARVPQKKWRDLVGRIRRGRSAGDAAVDDPVRDHLGRPVADWQKRPVPWEYTSKAQYRHDLQKFMEEVYGDSGN